MIATKKAILSPIESFHWKELDDKHYRLSFYDLQGHQAEKTISKEILDSALKLFNGKTHLIKRSSGGYSPAFPNKLLIYHSLDSETPQELQGNILRINATFLDFERNDRNEIISSKLILHNKNVSPSSFRLLADKEDPFKHQYWLDSGSQIIPVSVFDFFRSQDEIIRACFVKTKDLNTISKVERGQKRPITIYSAPESVLRVSLPEEANSVVECHTASMSLLALSKDNNSLDIPDFLKFGPPQTIPTGSPIDILNHYLRICQDPHSISLKKSFLSVLERPIEIQDESNLLPFGVFERT
ncbi:MAG: hypothetical protein FJ112_05390 [Deltaproteobacteria bacterium]|nr:hypothetical protein [Deltaproteobacteria bacterium]